jgi:lipid-binding SYLF domain-containing protein
MRICITLAAAAASLLWLPLAASARQPDQTIHDAQIVLDEFLDLRVRGIPARLLSEAHGVAVIPNVIKVGLVVGGQRGKGVVIIREDDGSWRAPMFITLTGGSVGWQAGAQATDVVLVFKSQRSVEGLLRGKFTIGADAAAAAGPVGRRAGAATDGELRAEIYTYSRTRGLFAGVSLEGSVLEVDERLNAEYYAGQPPEAAVKLSQRVAQITANPELIDDRQDGEPTLAEPLPAPAGPTLVPAGPTLAPAGPTVPVEPARGPIRSRLRPRQQVRPQEVQPIEPSQPIESSRPIEIAPQPALDVNSVRRDLSQSYDQLERLVDKDWQRYLELPDEVEERGKHPSIRELAAVAGRYDAVATDVRYRSLAQRPEFQATHESLHIYLEMLRGENPSSRIALPPPPGGR